MRLIYVCLHVTILIFCLPVLAKPWKQSEGDIKLKWIFKSAEWKFKKASQWTRSGGMYMYCILLPNINQNMIVQFNLDGIHNDYLNLCCQNPWYLNIRFYHSINDVDGKLRMDRHMILYCNTHTSKKYRAIPEVSKTYRYVWPSDHWFGCSITELWETYGCLSHWSTS